MLFSGREGYGALEPGLCGAKRMLHLARSRIKKVGPEPGGVRSVPGSGLCRGLYLSRQTSAGRGGE